MELVLGIERSEGEISIAPATPGKDHTGCALIWRTSEVWHEDTNFHEDWTRTVWLQVVQMAFIRTRGIMGCVPKAPHLAQKSHICSECWSLFLLGTDSYLLQAGDEAICCGL